MDSVTVTVGGFSLVAGAKTQQLVFNAYIKIGVALGFLVTGLRILNKRLYGPAHKNGNKFYTSFFTNELAGRLIIEALEKSEAPSLYPDFFPLPPDAYKGIKYSQQKAEFYLLNKKEI